MVDRSRCLGLALQIFVLIVLAPAIIPVAAQEGVRAWVESPDITNFPEITTFVDVRDASGNFVYGLDPDSVTVFEAEQSVAVTALTRQRPGVQLVVAVNGGPSFAIRNSQGQSRFDFMRQAVMDWSESRLGSTIDDLSLLANEHPDASHISSIEQWLSTLQAYQPDPRNAVPDLTVLARAIDVAADATPRDGMGKAVLFITAPPDAEAGVGLQSLASRARQLGVRIFVWLVASTERFSSEPANQLANLAAETGGQYFAYSGFEVIPEIETYLEPLRNTYLLTYTSQLTTSGTHSLSIQVAIAGSQVISEPIEFELEVLPPNVAFISPQLNIQRQWNGDENSGSLFPRQENLEVLIEFPDGHPRYVEWSRLYVDNEIVAVNSEPPFDQFTWDLDGYGSDGEHILKVEVGDSLGMSGTSMETVVSVTIKSESRSVFLALSRNRSLFAGIAATLAAAVLVLVLIRGGHLRPGFILELRRKRRRSDPVTQPVNTNPEGERQRFPGWFERLNWPQRRLAPQSMAFLIPLSDTGSEKSRPPISISNSEVTLGCNPELANHAIKDASVDEVHARLHHDGKGAFRIADLGSVAGTYVNYTPVSREGSLLEHGDLVHIGRVGFRFNLRHPARVRKPVIISKEPEL
jgi:hypothetical protein